MVFLQAAQQFQKQELAEAYATYAGVALADPGNRRAFVGKRRNHSPHPPPSLYSHPTQTHIHTRTQSCLGLADSISQISGDPLMAIPYWQRALEIDPDDEGSWLKIALGKYTACMMLLGQRGVDMHPSIGRYPSF